MQNAEKDLAERTVTISKRAKGECVASSFIIHHSSFYLLFL
jgi:hypothetical protein